MTKRDKNKIKPSECRERMLKALGKRYRATGTSRMDWDELLEEAGIPATQDARNAHEQLGKEGYLQHYILGAFAPILELSARGVEYARWLTRSRRRKAWDAVKSDVRTFIVVALASLLIAYLAWQLGWR